MRLRAIIAVAGLGFGWSACGSQQPDGDMKDQAAVTLQDHSSAECILLDVGPVQQTTSAEFDTMSSASLSVFLAHMMDLDGATSLRDVYAVRSTAHEKVYYISAEVDAPGLEGDGDHVTWVLAGDLESDDKWTGLIQAVGADRGLTKFVGSNDAFSKGDESARDAEECVGQASG